MHFINQSLGFISPTIKDLFRFSCKFCLGNSLWLFLSTKFPRSFYKIFTKHRRNKPKTLVIKPLLHHPFRLLSSVLGIALGIVSVITLLSISEGAKDTSIKALERLGTRKLFLEKLSDTADWKFSGMRAFEGRATALPLYIKEETLYGGIRPMRIEEIGVTESFFPSLHLKVVKGRALQPIDLLMRKEVCVIGYDLAKEIGPRASIGSSLRVGERKLTVVGILSDPRKEKSGRSLTKQDLSKALLYPFTLDPEGNLSELILEAKDPKSDHDLLKFTREFLKRKRLDESVKLTVPHELIAKLKETERLFHALLFAVGLITLSAGGLGIATVMLASCEERAREIGIRRAVGATKAAICQQFLLEALLLTSIGSVIGLIGGGLLSIALSYFSGWEVSFNLETPLLALFLAFVVGTLSGLYPAYKAASLDPIEALRQL